MKDSTTWYSPRLCRDARLVRWGTFGVPVLVFPTAGGDCEEIERMLLLRALEPLLRDGRIKVYSVDSVAAQAWNDPSASIRHCTWLQNQFDGYIYSEVVPAIRADCRSADIGIVTAGASIGAFNALASICRHPDAFTRAICMSGTYEVYRFIRDHANRQMQESDIDLDFYYSSPLHFIPNLPEGPELDLLRQRFVLLCHGGGRWEDPAQDWRMASILGRKRIPNRVDPWSSEYDHDWPTWRAMLPKYLSEL